MVAMVTVKGDMIAMVTVRGDVVTMITGGVIWLLW